jgi:3-mercaptopyruvate sulfurtransferase SseA
VALQLRAKGIKQVRPLAGGFFGWRDKGYPMYLDPALEVPRGPRKLAVASSQ